MRKNPEQKQHYEKIKSVATAVLAGIGAVSILLFVFGEIAVKIDVPDNMMSVMAQIALAAGCFAAAYTLSARRRKNGLILGLRCASAAFAAVFLTGIILSQGFSIGGIISKILIILSVSAIGGILGVNSKRRFR